MRCAVPQPLAVQQLTLFWNRLRPLRSLKISLPSAPAMAASSRTVTGLLARQVREAWEGSLKGSCGGAGLRAQEGWEACSWRWVGWGQRQQRPAKFQAYHYSVHAHSRGSTEEVVPS